jgi:hypothetical protein
MWHYMCDIDFTVYLILAGLMPAYTACRSMAHRCSNHNH